MRVDIERRVIRKIWLHVLGFIMLLWVVNYLDRVNIGFAALQMNQQLGFSATVYGFGAGLFFLPYALCELPSNLILHRIGARFWIARIMISWGLVSVCFAALNGATMFYILRFLLGMAEAGFVPGIFYYLTYWLPARHRAAAYSFGLGSSMLSSIVGAPLSGWILSATGSVGGLSAWRWMFLLEGIPAIILGVIVLFYLVDRPEQARWLSVEERDWLTSEIEEERRRQDDQEGSGTRWWLDSRIWLLAGVNVLVGFSALGVILWMPIIVRGMGRLTNLEVGLLTALPYICGYVSMQLNGWHSDRTSERTFHIAIPAVIGGLAIIASANAPSSVVAFIELCAASAGIFGYLGVFWTLPAQFLKGASAAAGFAVIGTIGQIGSFAGPFTVGWLKDTTGGFAVPLTVVGIAAMLQAVIVVISGVGRRKPQLLSARVP